MPRPSTSMTDSSPRTFRAAELAPPPLTAGDAKGDGVRELLAVGRDYALCYFCGSVAGRSSRAILAGRTSATDCCTRLRFGRDLGELWGK